MKKKKKPSRPHPFFSVNSGSFMMYTPPETNQTAMLEPDTVSVKLTMNYKGKLKKKISLEGSFDEVRKKLQEAMKL